jgi:hypothetical protein
MQLMCEKTYFQAARQELTVRIGMEATRFTPVQRLLTKAGRRGLEREYSGKLKV